LFPSTDELEELGVPEEELVELPEEPEDPGLAEPEDPELVDGLEEEEELDGVPEELDDELPPLILDSIGALAKTGIRAPTKRLKVFPCPLITTSDPSAKNKLSKYKNLKMLRL